MTEVTFFDFDFNRLGDYPKFVSLNIEKKYCGYGTAEIHYSVAESEILTLLEENEYLFFVANGNSAVVTGWRVGEDIAIFGRTCEWLLTKRAAMPFEKNGTLPETIVREVVTSGAGDFVDLGTLNNIGIAMSYSTEDVKTVYDVVCGVLKTQNLGFRLSPDIKQKKFIFDVICGSDSLCVLSQSNRTAYNMEYTVDKQNMAGGCGWYKRRYKDMGSWDAEKNLPSLADNQSSNAYKFYHITSQSYDSSGERIELFGLFCANDSYLYCDSANGKWKVSATKPDTIWIYLGTPTQTGAKKWDVVLEGIKTEEEAFAEIAKKIRSEDSETETKNVVYGNDYNLGDVLRVQTEFGDFKKTERKRVTAVNIYFDVDKSGVIPILDALEV